MTIDARLESLGQRHRDLKSLLGKEQQHPFTDNLRMHDLKRKKLAIKDEMSTLAAALRPK